MVKINLKDKIEIITNKLNDKNRLVIKEFIIGNTNPINCALIYINGLTNKDLIDRDILHPLMIYGNNIPPLQENIEDYLMKRYITMSNTAIETDFDKTIKEIKSGKSALIVDNTSFKAIIIDTVGGSYRQISEPTWQFSVRGTKEAFVENLETNQSIIKRRIKDNSLVIETLVVGRRSQTDLNIVYINDIVDKDVLNELKRRLSLIDIDDITGTGMIEECIESHHYTPFPQFLGTEKPDVVESNLMEGRIAIMLSGTPYVMIAPSVFIQFFQAPEDYYQDSLIASFTRILRLLAALTIITLPSIYLTLVKYNAELIPINFISPIVQSRIGIALNPFLEILSMQIIVEFLREGGLRLPSKIGQTLSVVGGIIIGDAAVKSRIVSPTTLLIVGIWVVATFIIPNYEMTLALRLISFPILLLANSLGVLGLVLALFVILVHLCSMDSLGVPYLTFKKSDMKDIFVRAPVWQMKERPKTIPNNNSTKATSFRNKLGGNNNEQK